MRGLASYQVLGAIVTLAACGTTGMPSAGTDATAAPADAGSPAASDGPSADTSPAIADGPSAAAPETAASACSLDRPYDFFRDGGLRIYQDRSKLMPPRQHTITRDRLRGAPPATCARTLPCETVDALGRAISHPDVLEAMKLAARPHYGSDPRPVDGTIFVFQRDDGRGFSVGPGNVPAGVRALEEALLKVEMESLAAPECAQLK